MNPEQALTLIDVSSPPPGPGAILARMTPIAPKDDTEHRDLLIGLIEHMASGDEAALGRFYELTLANVFGLALRLTRRHDLAEEVCVETYWQCWQEAARYDALRGHPMAWLLVMARSRALDALRRLDRATSCADPDTLLENERCPNGTPLEHLLDCEQNRALGIAIGQLSAAQRQVLALAFYRDMTHQAISDETGLPLGTVKSHLKRAQDALRTAFRQKEA